MNRLKLLTLSDLQPHLPALRGVQTQILIWWDGLVSGLRVYSVRELREMVKQVENSDSYTWEIEELRAGPAKVPYLVGLPKRT